jgi:HK97 family phage major capsid protein
MRSFDYGRLLLGVLATAPAGLLSISNDVATRPSLKELRKQQEDDKTELKALLEKEEDELSDDELDSIEELKDSIKARGRRIGALEIVEEDKASNKSRGRRALQTTDDDEDETAKRKGTKVPAQPRNTNEDRKHGFTNFGEFASLVGKSYKNRDSSALERLSNAATTFGTESVGGDGGWLVPPDFSTAIWQKVNGEGSLLDLCQPFETSRNSLTFPKDETTPWSNSSGVKVFWEGEGELATESKPKFETSTARLKKLMALVKVTEELLEDSVGLDSYLRNYTPVRMQARINTAIVRGDGVGKPTGILAASSLITISKETSQDAATIIMPNINKMWARLYAPLRANAVWLINQEVEPMLDGMAFIPSAFPPGSSTTAFTSYLPVYMPPNGMRDTPFALLKGRPVMPMQPCSALGTIGDIILVDLKQYMALRKAASQGIQVDTSIHLHFDQAIDTYRFMFRVEGQPIWNSTIAAENGSATYGWAVTLETRS